MTTPLRDRIEHVVRHGPGGPFRERNWRSPLRGPWLTSVLASVLLAGLLVLIVTGLLSYGAYDPALGGSNEQTPGRGALGFYLFTWPTSPTWLYRVNQGLHVVGGIALIPVVLAKLWSVAPKLFEWPPVRSVAQALERISLLMIVGGILFLIVTGVMNIQYDYAFGFSFYTGHFYAAWVFIAGFAAHVALKLPLMVRTLRSRSFVEELRTPLARTVAEPRDPDHLVSPDPAEPTISRRGALAVVGGGSLGLLALSVGQSIDPLRPTALLSPRGQSYGDGPNDFQVNTTFAETGVDPAETGASWRLELVGPSGSRTLRRDELLAMGMVSHELPISCVEGWSTSQRWTGVRLAELAELVGGGDVDEVFVESLQRGGAFSTHSLTGRQIRADKTLLALKVNGVDLSPDHGFPARVIVPAAPGVRNTKWVRRMTFGGAA